MSRDHASLLKWAAVGGIAACVVLMGLRLSSAVSFAVPLQLVTSGWEQESLLAIWEAQNGRPVYVSRWEIPFRWAVYNWLYYDAYAAVSGWLSVLLSLEAPWLPTVTRLITVTGMAACVGATFWSFRSALQPQVQGDRWVMWAFAVLVAAGPLVGYWGMTTRPDVWALALEILAVATYWSVSRKHKIGAIVLFCCVAYVAWSFKQSAVVAVGALGILLLARRRWTELVLLIIGMVSAWGCTLAVGSDIYRTSILLSEYTSTLTLDHTLGILVAALPKIIPPALGITAIGYMACRHRHVRQSLWSDDTSVFALAGVGIGVTLALLGGRQPGAAENYYFSPLFFAALATLAALRLFSGEHKGVASTLVRGQVVAWGLQTAAIAAVLVGAVGTTSVRHLHDSVMARKTCLDELPRPLFVNDHYLSLPWMTPGNPSFVLAFGYHADRLAGRKYRHDGIGGLIAKGHFAALAFGHDPEGRYDGASLSGYEPAGEPCAGLHLYRRAGLS